MGVAFYAENDMRWASGTVGVSFRNYSFNGDFISMIFKKKNAAAFIVQSCFRKRYEHRLGI